MNRLSACVMMALVATVSVATQRQADAQAYRYSRTTGVSCGGSCACCSPRGGRFGSGYQEPCWQSMQTPYAAPAQMPTPTPDAMAAPDAAPQPEQVPSQNNFSDDLLASQESGATSSDMVAMTMIGDFFFSGGYQFNSLDYLNRVEPTGGAVSIAGGDRRTKIAENTSPLPVDRIYFNYNHFQNALMTQDAPPPNFTNRIIDLNRYTLGGEKTFFGGQASIEARVPFANGLSSSQIQTFNPGVDNVGNELGNISLIPKVLLYYDGAVAVSTGVGVILPTADNARLYDRFNRLAVEVENDAVHLQPFLGLLVAPADRCFLIAYAQADFDANGNGVTRYPGFRSGTNVLQDQTLLYLDVAAGYWAYLNRNARYLRGIAPTVELHYTTTLSDADRVPLISSPYTRWDALNITGGIHFQLGTLSRLTVAGGAPLLDGSGHQYDAEVQVQFNRFF